MSQFISKLGANGVRLPINEPTVSQYWSTYTGAIDAILSQGMVVFCYWAQGKDSKPPDMTAFWNMWQTVVDKYGSNSNAYFEIYNEPNMYSKSDLASLYNDWLTRFSTVPKGRVILDGTGNAQNVSDVGSDSRFNDCLLAVHDYSFFGSDTWTSESQWEDHLKGEVGNYADRTVCTEWGGPMSPGSKNGIEYDYLDYSKTPTNYFEAYIRGMSNQLRAWKMGSFYWIGLRDGDWYSMTIKSGSGADITLSIPNQSGLERLQYSWTSTPGSGGTAGSGGAGGTGNGGSAGSGGIAPTGGAVETGGGGGVVVTGGTGPTGGVTATGGRSGRGGTAAGGSSATGGATAVATGGATAVATGGSSTTPAGGRVSTGGSTSTTGGTASPAGGGASGNHAAGGQPSSGGSEVTGGAPAAGGLTNTGGATTSPETGAGPIGTDASSDEGGCGCRVAGRRSSSSAMAAFGLLGLLVLVRPLRRRSRALS